MHMLWILSLAKSKAELDPAVLGHFALGKAWIQPIQPGRPIAKDAPLEVRINGLDQWIITYL